MCPPWTISSRRARAMLDFVIIVWPVLNRVSHIYYEFGIYSLSERILAPRGLQKLSSSRDDPQLALWKLTSSNENNTATQKSWRIWVMSMTQAALWPKENVSGKIPMRGWSPPSWRHSQDLGCFGPLWEAHWFCKALRTYLGMCLSNRTTKTYSGPCTCWSSKAHGHQQERLSWARYWCLLDFGPLKKKNVAQQTQKDHDTL